MKKMILVLMALMMAMMGVSAVAEVAAETVTGDWYGSVFGMAVKMTLNEDGTYVMATAEGEKMSDGTWAQKDDAIYMDGGEEESDKFQITDGTLVNTPMNVTFYRTQEEVKTIELAEVNPEAKAEEFNGQWNCKYLETMGAIVDIDKALATGETTEIPQLSFQDGKLTLVGGGLESMVTEEGLDMTYADGAYTFALEFGELSIKFSLNLLQDGLLAFHVDMGELGIGMYFEKTE